MAWHLQLFPFYWFDDAKQHFLGVFTVYRNTITSNEHIMCMKECCYKEQGARVVYPSITVAFRKDVVHYMHKASHLSSNSTSIVIQNK